MCSRRPTGPKASGIGDFGGGSFEHPWQWPGAPGPGLSARECRSAQSRQARPEAAREPSSGTAEVGALLACRQAGERGEHEEGPAVRQLGDDGGHVHPADVDDVGEREQPEQRGGREVVERLEHVHAHVLQ